MSDTATIPALMHFPLARRLAEQGWRIRRSIMRLMPGQSGDEMLAWFEYDAGLWYVHTWEGYELVKRVVTAADFTSADMLAEDWTVLGIECDLAQIECGCAGVGALERVPPYPVDEATEDLTPTFDMLTPNARMGLVGCSPGNLDGSCSCQEPATGPATDSSSDPSIGLGGGGASLAGGSPGRGGGVPLPGVPLPGGGGSGGGGGGGSGSGSKKPKKPKKRPQNSNSVSVDGDCDRTECYDSLEGTSPGRDPVHWAGGFTLHAEGSDLWFYTVVFKGRTVDQGTVRPGDYEDIYLTVELPNPGASYAIQVRCHKPFDDSASATGNASCDIPDYCGARPRARSRDRSPRRDARRRDARRRPARRERRRDARRRPARREEPRRPSNRRVVRPRRGDDRRPRRPDDRRRTRRDGGPSYGITVNETAGRTACYTEAELTETGTVPLLTFNGDFTINSDSGDPGTWHYTIKADGETIGGGDCGGNESVIIPDYDTASATPGQHITFSVTASRTDGLGSANGAALGNVPEMCESCPGDHEHLNPETNECECDEGYERVGEDCMEECAGSNRHRDPDTLECVCDDGYEEYEGNCVPVCGIAEHRNEEGECVCDDGYERVGGVCVPVCGEHETRDGEGVCQCDEGYERYGGDCVPECGANQHRNVEGACVCDDGYEDVDGDCLPICGIAEHRDPGTGECVCDDGYERVGGICVAVCGSNEHRVESGACECDAGYHRDGSGVCVPDE